MTALEALVWGISAYVVVFSVIIGSAWLASRWIMPALGIGRIIDTRPIPPGQVGHELRQSAITILIYGVGVVIPWAMLHFGWARLAIDPPAWQIALELAVLFVWNDVHFWGWHRLLHTRRMFRFHRAHHRSVIPTPVAVYSFHPVEALMLGSVILVPMMLHDFSIWSLMAIPFGNIVLTGIGHANYDWAPSAATRHWLALSRRHCLHHARPSRNFGFQFTFMDRLFGTLQQDDLRVVPAAPATAGAHQAAKPPVGVAPIVTLRTPA
ncbi:MAG: sterol desaturase family protein [Variovorax sp.]